MKLPSFIPLNPYNRFKFTPRYYDERKERLSQLEDKYHGEHSVDATRDRLKGSFKKTSKSKGGTTNIRLLLLIAVMSFVAWYWLLR